MEARVRKSFTGESMKINLRSFIAVCMLLTSGMVAGSNDDNRKFKISPTCTDPAYAEDIGRFGIVLFRTDNSGKRIIVEWTAHDKDGLPVDKGTTALSNCTIVDGNNWKCLEEAFTGAEDRLISVSEMKDGTYRYEGHSSYAKTCTANGIEIK